VCQKEWYGRWISNSILVGLVTFEEAYWRSGGRILNIIVSSTKTNEVPKVLNYLTAPKVLIWSACCASVAIFGLYENIDLMAKGEGGIIHPWNPSSVKWSDTYYDYDDSETVDQRLGELFHCNHIIYSQGIFSFVTLYSSL
jgi:TAG lipase/lysophosphatidylethanolamine acyltransferase